MRTDSYPYYRFQFDLVHIPGTLAFYEEVHPYFQIPVTLNKTSNQWQTNTAKWLDLLTERLTDGKESLVFFCFVFFTEGLIE